MRQRDKFSVMAGGTAVVAAILIVGGALRWGQAIVALVVAIALAPQVLSRRALDRPSPLIALIGIAIGLTVIQLIPVPAGLTASLDPIGAALRSDGAKLGEVTPWPSLSLDAPNSLRALAFFTILMGVAILSLRFSATERGRYSLLTTITCLIGFTALVAGVHKLFGVSDLYGLYEPFQAAPPIVGPLLNANHLGSLMAVGAVLAMSLLVYPNQAPFVRGVWATIALACIAVILATLSRGATLALIGGTAVAGSIVVAQKLSAKNAKQRRRRRRFMITTLPIGVATLCGLVVVVMVSATGVTEQLTKTSLQEIHEPRSKYAAWKSSVTLAEESPWVGIGRGALEPSLTRVHPASTFVTFSHLENEYIQAVVEWGVPGSVLLAIAFGWLVMVAVGRWRDGPLTAGALGAVTVVAVQSNVDFGVELLGLAVPITAIAATLVYVPLREVSTRVLPRLRVLRLATMVALVGAAIVLFLPITTSVAEDNDVLEHDPDLDMDDVRDAIARHPLNYYGYARAADLLLRTNDNKAIKMLNHALVLHPTHSGLHRMAGRVLHWAKRDWQAAIEYSAAIQGTTDPHNILAEVTEMLTDPEDAANAIPVDFQNTEQIVRTLEPKHADIATRWLDRVLESRPRDLTACELLYDLSVAREDNAAAESAGRRCLDILPSHKSHLALAKILLANGKFAEVERQLAGVETWADGLVETKATGWMALCDAKIGLSRWDDAEHCLHRLDASGLAMSRRSEIVTRLQRISEERHGPPAVPSDRLLK